MADIIQLLPESIANQIAAGEVIQRPASVVKELLENAIDALASDIQLIIKDAGKTLIQVIDNGKGMSATDARMSFERHATSKIKQAKDLFEIRTMGFRGEALASIASIAHVELKTRSRDDEIGTHIVIRGSKIEIEEQISFNPGSSIAVKNLFYNIPARRKFLKTEPTELKHITEEFKRIAITNPQIRFVLIHNDVEIYHLPESNLRKRIINIFGKNINDKLVPVEETTDIISISGYIGKPEVAKRGKDEQKYFFVNNRFIKSNYLNHAVKAAFSSLIGENQTPFYILNFEIDPAQIDINVHPTKTEIKFEEERLVYQYLKVTVQHALGKYAVVPSLDFQNPDIFVNHNPNPQQATNYQDKAPAGFTPKPNVQEIDSWNHFYHNLVEQGEEGASEQTSIRISSEISNSDTETSTEFGSVRASFQIHNSYLISQIKSGYIIIHQQYAHERILYEKFLSLLIESERTTQQQLFPETVHLSADIALLLEQILEDINQLGFSIQFLGGQSFVIQGVPPGLSEFNPSELLQTLLEQYVSNLDLHIGVHENIARSLARSASIRKNKKLTSEEMNLLVDELFACEVPYLSPSGKKCFIEVELNELEKQF